MFLAHLVYIVEDQLYGGDLLGPSKYLEGGGYMKLSTIFWIICIAVWVILAVAFIGITVFNRIRNRRHNNDNQINMQWKRTITAFLPQKQTILRHVYHDQRKEKGK